MVRDVHVAKVSDLVAWLEARQGRRAPIDNGVYPGERRHQRGGRLVVPERLLGGGRLLFFRHRSFLGKIGKVLVDLLLNGIHELFVVIPKMDDARSGRPYFR